MDFPSVHHKPKPEMLGPFRSLPCSMYAPRKGGWGQACNTFPLRITCKKGVGGDQIACKIAYVLNVRPLSMTIYSKERGFTSPPL